jgi:hypothetical protein
VYDEDLIAKIHEQDPDWPPPNDDVEDLDDLNDSWATEVSGITEPEVQEQVSAYPDEVQGVIQIRQHPSRKTRLAGRVLCWGALDLGRYIRHAA